MEKFSAAEKVQLKTLKAALCTAINKSAYWIPAKEVYAIIDMAGPFIISETLEEMGYRIADRAESGAIHIARL